jgi:hypothetical protein
MTLLDARDLWLISLKCSCSMIFAGRLVQDWDCPRHGWFVEGWSWEDAR